MIDMVHKKFSNVYVSNFIQLYPSPGLLPKGQGQAFALIWC